MRLIYDITTGQQTIDAGYTPDESDLIDPADALAAWRATATITKVQLVRALRLLRPDGTLAEAGDTTAWATFGPLIEAHEDWPYITVIPRTDALACDMATAIGATPEQMDAIWQLGGTL